MVPGAGAAGGLGAGLLTLGATLESGIDIVIKINHLKEQIAHADIVFTGESGIDFQENLEKLPVAWRRLFKNSIKQ